MKIIYTVNDLFLALSVSDWKSAGQLRNEMYRNKKIPDGVIAVKWRPSNRWVSEALIKLWSDKYIEHKLEILVPVVPCNGRTYRQTYYRLTTKGERQRRKIRSYDLLG